MNIVDVQRQEADLADRQRVAARTNLDLLNQQIQARQSARPAQYALENLQFQQQQAQLQAEAIRANVRRGVADPSTLSQIPELRRQLRSLALEAPQASLSALQANRPGTLIQRQLDQEQDTRQTILNQLEAEQRRLDDQLIPLQEAQRLTDEATTSLETQLAIRDQLAAKERQAAVDAQLAAQSIVSASQAAATNAQYWVDSITTGMNTLLAAETNLSDSGKYLPGVGVVNNGVPQTTPQPYGGNVTVQFTGDLSVRSQSDIDQIAQKAAQLALEAIQKATKYSPAASSTGLVGAYTP
jgi:hypothetical protein